jgi:hypothetical protein
MSRRIQHDKAATLGEEPRNFETFDREYCNLRLTCKLAILAQSDSK